MTRAHLARRHAFCLLLIAAALLVRALVPQGWMVDRAPAGGVAITMCNTDMTVTIPFKSAPAPKQADKSQTCAFAGHHNAAAPPEGLAPLPLPLLAPAPYNATRAQALSPERPQYLPPATGPPVTA